MTLQTKHIWMLAAALSLAAVNSLAQNQWRISISGGILSPEFFIGDSPGNTFEASVLYQLSDSLQLTACTGVRHWKEKLGPGGTSFRSIPVLAGMQLPFLSGRVSPYLVGEIGLEFVSREYTFEVYEVSDLGVYRRVSSNPAKESGARFALRLGAGLTAKMSDVVHLDLSARYGKVAYRFDYTYAVIASKGSLSTYNILLGARFAL